MFVSTSLAEDSFYFSTRNRKYFKIKMNPMKKQQTIKHLIFKENWQMKSKKNWNIQNVNNKNKNQTEYLWC